MTERQLEVLKLALSSARITMPESLHELARRCRNSASALLKAGRPQEADCLAVAGDLMVTMLHLSLPIDQLLLLVGQLVNDLKSNPDSFDVSKWVSQLTPLRAKLDQVPLVSCPVNQVPIQSKSNDSNDQTEPTSLCRIETFIDEASLQLDEIEVALCSLASGHITARSINCLFRHLHALKGLASFVGKAEIARVTHASEEVVQLVREGKQSFNEDSIAAIFGSADWIREQIAVLKESLRDQQSIEIAAPHSQVLDLIACCVPSLPPGRGPREITMTQVDAEPAHTPMAAAVGADVSTTAQPKIADASRGNRNSSASRATQKSREEQARAESSVKVDRQLLDEFIELIGQLSLAETQLEDEWAACVPKTSGKSKVLPKLRKLGRELQVRCLQLRATPINGLFRRMGRVVYDLSRKINKPAELVIEGGDTGLDKTIIDQVADPLMHLIRNSMDHGIEGSTDDRLRAGKSPQARIILRAYQQGGFAFVEVEDDGRGLNRQRIRAKAIERGLITADRRLTDDETFRLIFQPGFSTADKLTEISGRGVGMDVVKQNIEALNGSVDIRSHEGRGTTVSLRLPLTLAILDALILRLGSDRVIIPIARVHETFALTPSDIQQLATGGVLRRRQFEFPCLDLKRVLGIEGGASTGRIVVMVESQSRPLGLIIDEVVGRMSVTQRPLDVEFPVHACVSGGAIMADGRVSLILDLDNELFGPNANAGTNL